MSQDNSTDTVEVKRNYHPSGALWIETPFVNGYRHGLERGYDKEKMNIWRLKLYDNDQEVVAVKI